MPKVMPALTKDGWNQDPSKIADYLISHFFLSDFSQSQLYHSKISSLPYLINEHQKDVSQLVRQTEQTLLTYFSRYFNDVEVEVLEADSNEGVSDIGITIYIGFTSDNVSYTLSKLIQTNNSIISKVIDINNTGAST